MASVLASRSWSTRSWRPTTRSRCRSCLGTPRLPTRTSSARRSTSSPSRCARSASSTSWASTSRPTVEPTWRRRRRWAASRSSRPSRRARATSASGWRLSMGDLAALRKRLEELDRVVVAFSGGADSAFLAWMAHDTLRPQRAPAGTAGSPSLAPEEADDCAALAAEWGLRWRPVPTDELAQPAYVANDGDRCYHCKTELMGVAGPLAEAEGATVVLGVNVDDLGDHRPGQRAAA